MIHQNREEDFRVDAGACSEGNLVCVRFGRVNLNPFLDRVLA